MKNPPFYFWICFFSMTSLAFGTNRGNNLAPPLRKWHFSQPKQEKQMRRTRQMVEVKGRGKSSNFWKSPLINLSPKKAYLLRFQARGKAGEGSLISGTNWTNRDFRLLPKKNTYSFAFRPPSQKGGTYLRLGQWHLQGRLMFSAPELVPIQVAHRKWGGITLGEGEELRRGTYVDNHVYSWQGSTIHRTLHKFNASFNTNRWGFSKGAYVIYRHQIPLAMKSGKVSININYYIKGDLSVLASQDGENWKSLGKFGKVRSVDINLPASLFPSSVIYIKLSANSQTYLQVNSYAYQGTVDYRGASLQGETHLIEEKRTSPYVQALWQILPRGWKVEWRNLSSRTLSLKVEQRIRKRWKKIQSFRLRGHKTDSTILSLPPLATGKAVLEIRLRRGYTTLYQGRLEPQVGILEESHYGYFLTSSNALSLWWCESPWKVGRDRLAPKRKTSKALRISLAKGEFEPVQLVIRSKIDSLAIKQISILPSSQAPFPGKIQFFEVAYLPVRHPSDLSSKVGNYPDPLAPFQKGLKVPRGKNQPLWILVWAPRKSKAGKYKVQIQLKTNQGAVEIPLFIRVYSFSLPKTSHLQSGFGISPSLIRRYHHLKNRTQERAVWDLYMKNFRDHRISPYTFAPFDPIKVHFKNQGRRKKLKLDFRAFDRQAKRYLDQFGFNGFRLRLRAMGSGSFQRRRLGKFGGYAEGTPEYNRLFSQYLREVESHLKQRGWLQKAYVYWFDEPARKDYPFVIQGMKKIKKSAPSLRRLLTEQPERELFGSVDIWCGLTPHWTKKMVADRRRAGEEVWWYICTGPKAPYIGLFMEHPATVMRLWPWQSWQYGIQGILIWQTTYWTSGAAFPNRLQDVWKDPMSYVSAYSAPKGTRSFWGNGDGRFLYPPRRNPNQKQPPALTGPISSLRWENLRDGMEDYEYFWLLKKEIRRLKGRISPGLLNKARLMLKVPRGISQDLTHYTRDPRPLLDHRRKMAEMIEALGRK